MRPLIFRPLLIDKIFGLVNPPAVSSSNDITDSSLAWSCLSSARMTSSVIWSGKSFRISAKSSSSRSCVAAMIWFVSIWSIRFWRTSSTSSFNTSPSSSWSTMRHRISLFLGSIASSSLAISYGLREESLLRIPTDLSFSRSWRSWVRFFSVFDILFSDLINLPKRKEKIYLHSKAFS